MPESSFLTPEKAKQDVARLEESRKGLLRDFEFPDTEQKEERQHSKETLLADIYEEKLKGAYELIKNPIFLSNAVKYVEDCAKQGSEEEGENTGNAVSAFLTLSSLTAAKDYLRAKGKTIDDERFAKEALNPEKKIPPRPQRKVF